MFILAASVIILYNFIIITNILHRNTKQKAKLNIHNTILFYKIQWAHWTLYNLFTIII